MDNIVINKNKKISEEDLNNLTKDELIARVKRMEKHNNQLKNIINKKNNESSQNGKHLKAYKQRPFDFSKCFKRHILLKFYYLGWDYQGFATQEDTNKTIEYYLFDALTKACLIENRISSNYHRCGRTDKGVSAFSQVISLDIRSLFPSETQMDATNIKNELRYCHLLNRLLPSEIRCISWAPLTNEAFSARFDCKRRTYKYFFPRGDMNIEAMREGCLYLIGAHDFRNLCKMDVGNGVVAFTRNIQHAEIVSLSSENYNNESGFDMFSLILTGKAFLWHQVRCIMGILILIGQCKEDPKIIKELLDVTSNPCKPQYNLANDVPLNLYYCEYVEDNSEKQTPQENEADSAISNDQVNWITENENLERVIEELQWQWSEQSIKSAMIREMLKDLQKEHGEINTKSEDCSIKQITSQAEYLLQGVKPKSYQKLMDRVKCGSLEDRIDHYVKKRRIQVKESELDDS